MFPKTKQILIWIKDLPREALYLCQKFRTIMETQNLIPRLQENVQRIIETVETELLPLGEHELNRKPAPEKWSVLECFEHLNRYNRFYNPELERAIEHKGKAAAFRPGWLGNYFVQSVIPENEKPIKTMGYLNPTGSRLSVSVLEEFLGHQRHLLELLTKAKGANLNRRAVRVEVFRLLRIKTGDAFRFIVTHQQRHLQQALRAVRVIV